MLDPQQAKGSDNFIDHYDYHVNGKKEKLLPEDVVHFRFGLDPHNIRKGLSPIKTLMREIFTDDEAANFTAALLRNAGIPGVVISPREGSLQSDQDLQNTKKYIKERFSGDKRGEPLATMDAVKVEQFGFSPQQLDLSKLRKIPEERVTAALGIPAAVVGFGSGLENTKVGATMRELREQAYENGIIPMQRFMGDDIATQLLSDYEPDPDSIKVTWDYSQVRVLQEDENKKAERTGMLWEKGLITREQGKQALGYETAPADQVYRYPFNVVLVSEKEALLPAPESEPEDEPQNGNGNNGNGEKSILRKPDGKRMGLVDLNGQTKEAMFNAIAEAREAGEGPPAIAARIENQVAAGPWRDSRTRAHVIGRTETKYAQNVSTLQAYKQSDTIGAVQIADGRLENSCDYCISIDGEIVSFTDAEVLAASEHPNGTRSFTPVFGVPETVHVESQEAFEAREG